MFGKEIAKKAQEHAKRSYPFESVGSVVNTGAGYDYIEFENIAEDKAKHFLVSSDDLVKFLPTTAAIIHSHCSDEHDRTIRLYPSRSDMESQLALKVPFGIIYASKEIASNILWFGDGAPKAPLEGRYFIHGVHDCYSLVRDYYLLELGIKLKEFPRDWEWWRNGESLYTQGFSQTGFMEVTLNEVKRGDLILMAVTPETARANNPCHGAIYLGDEMILHHLAGTEPYDKGRLSCKANIQRYKNLITHVLRHEEND